MSKKEATVLQSLLKGEGDNVCNGDGDGGSNGTARPKNMRNDPNFEIRPLQQLASACTGSIITAGFMTPMDVLKTRIQSQQKQVSKSSLKQSPQFRSTLDGLVKISRHEGIGALWSGLGLTLVATLPSNVVYFAAYEQSKAHYSAFYQRHFAPPAHNQKPSMLVSMLSGVTARSCAVTVVSPIELLRTKMQSQRLSYAQLLQCVRNVIAQQGITGLWRGLAPTILRDVPFSGIYWPAYEYLKFCFSKRDAEPSIAVSFGASVLAGSAAALVTSPFDVVKTHEQIEFGERVISTDSSSKQLHKKSTYSRLAAIYRVFGLRGFFAGCAPRLLKVAPACAIMMSTYEYSKLYFFNYNIHQHNAKLVKEDDID